MLSDQVDSCRRKVAGVDLGLGVGVGLQDGEDGVADPAAHLEHVELFLLRLGTLVEIELGKLGKQPVAVFEETVGVHPVKPEKNSFL